MPAYTLDQALADLDALDDLQPDAPAPLPTPQNDNTIDLDAIDFDAPVEPAPFVDRRPMLERYGYEIGPDGFTRKKRENPAPENRAQPQAGHGVAADRKASTPLAPSYPLSSASQASTRLSTGSPSSYSSKTPSSLERPPAPANQNWAPWYSLTQEEQEAVYLDTAEWAGAFSFRLTFSPAKEAKLRRQATQGRDIRRIINKAIRDQFLTRFGFVPPFAFVVEEARGTYRLHVHGCYVPIAGVDADQIRDAFIHAGGKIKGQSGSTQFWHRPAYTLPHYFRYSRKDDDQVMRRLGLEGVSFYSAEIKRLGRETYENARKPAHAPQAAVVAPEPVPARMSDDELLASLDDELAALNPLPAQEDDLVLDADDLAAIDAWLGPTPGAATTSIDEILALLDDFNVDGEDQTALNPIRAVTTAVLTHRGTASARRHVLPLDTPAKRNALLRSRLSQHGARSNL